LEQAKLHTDEFRENKFLSPGFTDVIICRCLPYCLLWSRIFLGEYLIFLISFFETVTGGQGRNQLFISGGQFLWNFIRWRQRADSTAMQLFRKRSDKVYFATFPKMRTFQF